MKSKNPLVSIITPTWNSAGTLPMSLASVAAQSYGSIEHIVIDGGSSDHTVSVLQAQRGLLWVSEPDHGLYHAINKGLAMASGEVIGVLNADDFYSGADIVAQLATSVTDVAAVYGDVVYVRAEDLTRTVRHFSSEAFRPSMFLNGYMPAHPTFFARRELFERYGAYRTDYAICADFELLLRLMLVRAVPTKYVPGSHVVMRTGGVSNATVCSRLQLNREMVRACRENGISATLPQMLWKYPHKIRDYLRPHSRGHDVDRTWLARLAAMTEPTVVPGAPPGRTTQT